MSMSFQLVRTMPLLVLLSQAAFGAEAAGEISLIERSILDGKATITVPAAFSLMPEASAAGTHQIQLARPSTRDAR